jgi:hypothetical protein
MDSAWVTTPDMLNRPQYATRRPGHHWGIKATSQAIGAFLHGPEDSGGIALRCDVPKITSLIQQ